MIYRLAPQVRLVAKEDTGLLIRDYPLRTMSCNASLWKLISKIKTDGIVESSAPVMESLAESGFLQRVWEKVSDAACPVVSIIIPVKDRADELARCLQSLSELDYPPEKLECIVVDDGSSDRSARVAEQSRATCIPSGGTGLGPAAARNQGARRARGEILAFIDSDCTATPDWLRDLVAPFTQADVAAVGGQVRGYFAQSWLDKYENAMSSLSVGKTEKWSDGSKDSFYLPSCNLLVRRKHFHGLGGFDEKMQVGEDVDLCYRLRDCGYRIGYMAAGPVFHAHRNRVRSFMSRRFAYGTSEALLQKKHGERKKNMQMSRATLLYFLLLPILVLSPGVGCALLIFLFGVDCRKQYIFLCKHKKDHSVKRGVSIVKARCRTLFSLGYYLSYHCIRYYLPLILPISLFDTRVGAVAALLFFWAASVDYSVKKAALGILPFYWLYLLEQLAYSCGVLWGCFKRNSFLSYRVKIEFRPFGKAESFHPL